jgi:hypothetical protein
VPIVVAGTPSPVIVFPDVELIVIRFLDGYLNVGYASDIHVGSTVPARTLTAGELPVIRVNRVGGITSTRIPQRLDEPTVDVDLWDDDADDLWLLAGRIRGLLQAMPGLVDEDSVITRVREVVGPGRRPEDDPNLFRIGFTCAVTLHPA